MTNKTALKILKIKADKLNVIIHSRNLYARVTGDNYDTRVVFAHLSPEGVVLANALHSGKPVDLAAAEYLRDGSGNVISFNSL